jgi:hypothetical protein
MYIHDQASSAQPCLSNHRSGARRTPQLPKFLISIGYARLLSAGPAPRRHAACAASGQRALIANEGGAAKEQTNATGQRGRAHATALELCQIAGASIALLQHGAQIHLRHNQNTARAAPLCEF